MWQNTGKIVRIDEYFIHVRLDDDDDMEGKPYPMHAPVEKFRIGDKVLIREIVEPLNDPIPTKGTDE